MPYGEALIIAGRTSRAAGADAAHAITQAFRRKLLRTHRCAAATPPVRRRLECESWREKLPLVVTGSNCALDLERSISRSGTPLSLRTLAAPASCSGGRAPAAAAAAAGAAPVPLAPVRRGRRAGELKPYTPVGPGVKQQGHRVPTKLCGETRRFKRLLEANRAVGHPDTIIIPYTTPAVQGEPWRVAPCWPDHEAGPTAAGGPNSGATYLRRTSFGTYNGCPIGRRADGAERFAVARLGRGFAQPGRPDTQTGQGYNVHGAK